VPSKISLGAVEPSLVARQCPNLSAVTGDGAFGYLGSRVPDDVPYSQVLSTSGLLIGRRVRRFHVTERQIHNGILGRVFKN
jgi:hypothetical protein